jgi:hypothetical protein
MTETTVTKNLTVSLSLREHADLDSLVDFFQKESISTVSKSDVIKFLLRRYKFIMDNSNDEIIKELEKRIKELTI